jgi:hypothetical protein
MVDCSGRQLAQVIVGHTFHLSKTGGTGRRLVKVETNPAGRSLRRLQVSYP